MKKWLRKWLDIPDKEELEKSQKQEILKSIEKFLNGEKFQNIIIENIGSILEKASDESKEYYQSDVLCLMRKKIHDSIHKEVYDFMGRGFKEIKEITDLSSSEKFIDSVVKRINSKQIKQ